MPYNFGNIRLYNNNNYAKIRASTVKNKMICIKTKARSDTGSFATRKYRKEGKIPANFYGKKINNVNLLIDPEEIVRLNAKRNCHIISLDIDGERKDVLIQDIQYHPVTMKPLHVDFFAVNNNEKLKVNIPIRYLNTDKCVGVKQGGHLNKIYRRLPLVCLPSDIPECIEIHVANFNIGKIVKVADIKLAKNLTPMLANNVVLCNIIGRLSRQQEKETDSSDSSS